MYIVASTGISSILQLFTLIIIFVLILFLTYWTTRFVGNYQKTGNRAVNFEVIDTYRISNTKYLQIMRVGEKYLVVSVNKDNIELLTELKKEELIIPEKNEEISFSKILEKMKHTGRQGSSNDEDDEK